MPSVFFMPRYCHALSVLGRRCLPPAGVAVFAVLNTLNAVWLVKLVGLMRREERQKQRSAAAGAGAGKAPRSVTAVHVVACSAPPPGSKGD